MAKKKSNVKVKKVNIIILVLVIILVALLISLYFVGKDSFKKKGKTKEVEVVDKIDNFDYYITENNTKYFEKLYNELKKVLSSDNIDEEKYATLISQLFVADFYDLNSKVSKNDVGGVQFISSKSNFREIFVKKASSYDGMYYSVKNNLYGTRKQNLPQVKETNVTSIKNTTFSNDDFKDNKAYTVNVEITYASDLGYQKNVVLTVIHNEKKLEIAEVR